MCEPGQDVEDRIGVACFSRGLGDGCACVAVARSAVLGDVWVWHSIWVLRRLVPNRDDSVSVDPDDERAEGVFLPIVLTDQIGGVDVQSILEEFDSFDLVMREESVQIDREPALGLLGEGGGQHALTHRSPHLEFPM